MKQGELKQAGVNNPCASRAQGEHENVRRENEPVAEVLARVSREH